MVILAEYPGFSFIYSKERNRTLGCTDPKQEIENQFVKKWLPYGLKERNCESIRTKNENNTNKN